MSLVFEKKKSPDSGSFRKPKVVETVPVVPFKVIDADIPFYRDPECQQQVKGAWITIIQALDPDDPILELDIVPTAQIYTKGDYVTMNLESKRMWDACWYKDPTTGKIEKAWNVHAEFIGDLISTTAVEGDKKRIADLERRLEERMAASYSTKEPVN